MAHLDSTALAYIRAALFNRDEEARERAMLAILEAEQAIADPDMIQAARVEHGGDDIQIDDDAGTSDSDEGVWVQAWVFMRDDTSSEEEEEPAAVTLESEGYRLTTYDGFMRGAVDFHTYSGCQQPHVNARQKHDEIREALRERAAAFDGTHVVYDPNSDEDGWLLVGDETAIRAETEKMLRDLAD